MGFGDFLGNERIVAALRGMLAAGRVPGAMLFSGAAGVGKYTLAVRFAQAANCEREKGDACGECVTCRRIEGLLEPEPLIAAGLAQRGPNPDAATVERVPLLLQTHPDVWTIVPDPVRERTPVARPMIRMGQLRAVQRAAYFKPEARRRVFILDGADTMRWNLASIFLKVLEEPPETATLILLAENAESLLQTIRSRCLQFFFAPVATEEVENFLKERRPELGAKERKLAAELSAGSPGTALRMDLDESVRLRKEALKLLELGVAGQGYDRLFAQTEQLTKKEKESFDNLLGIFYSLLTDILALSQGNGDRALGNPDLKRELTELARCVDLGWARRSMIAFDELHGRWRRNINRQLGLDAVTLAMEKS